MWAPVALLGIEVNRAGGEGAEGSSTQYRRLSDASEEDLEENKGGRSSVEASLCPENNGENTDNNEKSEKSGESNSELAGIYFGILNIFMTLPQLLASFISTAVFAIVEPGKSPELHGDKDKPADKDAGGPNAISICLFIGALSTFYAAFVTRKIKFL